MDKIDAAKLLTVVSGIDRREVTPGAAAVWAQALPDVTLPDALLAVREHVRASRDLLMPVHVLAGVRRIRERRERETTRRNRTGRACSFVDCRCTHTVCTDGFLDEQGTRSGPCGHEYTFVVRCPRCDQARAGAAA